MKPRPVLQYGNLAGWPFKLANGLSAIGQPSISVIPEDRDFSDLSRKLPFHETISKNKSPRFMKGMQRLRFLLGVPSRFSLVHYHASHFLRGNKHHVLEGPYLKSLHVPMIVSFAGSDARILAKAAARNPYFYRNVDPVHDAAIEKYLTSISRNIRFAATDCEMVEYVAPYFEHVFTFRQPINLEEITYNVPRHDRPPVLLHVPTDTEVKGTSHIIAAVERLQVEGHLCEFRIKRKLTQSELYREIEDCDIYVDELRCGSYGVTATEAMAAGKATVSFIRPDLVNKYPSDLPIVNANPESIYEILRRLVTDADFRIQRSEAGRRYVEKYHDSLVVAHEMLDVYKQIGLR